MSVQRAWPMRGSALWRRARLASMLLVLLAGLPLAPVGCRPAPNRTGPRSKAASTVPVSRGWSLDSNLGVARPFAPGVVYIGGDANLWSLDSRTGTRRRLLSLATRRRSGRGVHRFWVSPDRKRVAFTLADYDSAGRYSEVGLVVSRFGAKEAWYRKDAVVRQALWSDDGTKLAFVRWDRAGYPMGGSSVLEVLDLASGRDSHLLVLDDDYLNGISPYTWMGKDSLLVNAWERAPGGDLPEGSGWYVVKLNGKLKHLGGNITPTAAKYGRDGERLLRKRPRWRAVRIAFHGASWSADRQWLAVLQGIRLERRVGRSTESSGMNQLLLANGRTGHFRTLERATGPALDNFAWSTDGRTIYFWREIQRLSKAQRIYRALIRRGVSEREARLAVRGIPHPYLGKAANWLFLMSVRVDGSGKKVWLREMGDSDTAMSLATF